MSEVEELKKIIGKHEKRMKKLASRKKNKQKIKNNMEIERKLMKLSELEKKKQIEFDQQLKKELLESKYQEKYELLKAINQRLKQKYKELKIDLKQKKSELGSFDLEKCRLLSDIAYLKQENEVLRSELESFLNKYPGVNQKRPLQYGKKIIKSHSSKGFCKSTIPKIKINSKDSLVVSPLSNASLPTVQQYNNCRESDDREHFRILTGLPTTKGKSVSFKQSKSKK